MCVYTLTRIRKCPGAGILLHRILFPKIHEITIALHSLYHVFLKCKEKVAFLTSYFSNDMIILISRMEGFILWIKKSKHFSYIRNGAES